MAKNQNKSAGDIALEQGLPASAEAERFVLGSILLDYRHAFPQTAGLSEADFHLTAHQRIWSAMKSLLDDGADIDYLTLVTRLDKRTHLESIGGIAYVSGLTDGLPKLENIRSYVAIVIEKSRLRQIIRSSQLIINKAFEQEPSSGTLSYGVQQLCDISGEAGIEVVRMGDDLKDNLKGILDHQSHGTPTGLMVLDDLTGGLQPGELTVIGARPSVGKTAFALGIAMDCCMRSNHPCLIYSLEMTRATLAQRMICMLGRVDLYRLRMGYLNENERYRVQQAVKTIIKWPLYVNDRGSLNAEDLDLSIRSLMRISPRVVIIDYLQQLGTAHRYRSANETVSAIARKLKQIAKEHGVAVVALSQLSRDSEKRPGSAGKPQLSDLRDSGQIEQEADLVFFIYREEMYKPDREDLHGIAEVIVAKQRNGPTGTRKICFLHKFAKFENMALET